MLHREHGSEEWDHGGPRHVLCFLERTTQGTQTNKDTCVEEEPSRK
jgi:hypothetical protein